MSQLKKSTRLAALTGKPSQIQTSASNVVNIDPFSTSTEKEKEKKTIVISFVSYDFLILLIVPLGNLTKTQTPRGVFVLTTESTQKLTQVRDARPSRFHATSLGLECSATAGGLVRTVLQFTDCSPFPRDRVTVGGREGSNGKEGRFGTTRLNNIIIRFSQKKIDGDR